MRRAPRRSLAVAKAASLTAACLGLALVSGTTMAQAVASVLYVGGSSCSDNGTGTQGVPYCTIGAAARVAVAGQTVQVAAGTYSEDVRPAHSGTAAAVIAFTATPPGAAVVTGGDHAFDLSSRSYISVTGFTSRATTSSGLYLRYSDHITLTQNVVTTAGLPSPGYTAYGIYLNATTDSVVRGNVAYANSAAGFYLTGGATRNTIDGNESYANANGYQRAATGIDLRAPGNVITHNWTHDNEDSGIQAYPGGDRNVIAGNVSYRNKGFTTVSESNCDRPLSGAAGCIIGDHGIDDYGTYANVLTGNTVYDNVSAGINVEGITATSTTSAVGASDTTLPVSTATGFPSSGQYTIQVDNEQMIVVGGQGTTSWTVTRGANGTTAAAHTAGCSGSGCSPKRLNVLQYAGFTVANNLSVDNAINCPDGNGGVQTPCNRTKGELRVDQYSWVGTVADNDLLWTSSSSYPYVATWGNTMYKTVASLTAATGQEGRGRQADPLWVNASSHDFRLSSGSPAIDAANSGAAGEQQLDVLGVPRLDDPATTNTGIGPRTYDDLGAYEYQPSIAPPAPALSVAAGDGQAQLSWTAGTPNGAAPVTQWSLYRGGASGSETLLTSVDGSQSGHLDTGLTNGNSYFYYLVGSNAAGQSPPSNEVTATPTAGSPSPTPTPTWSPLALYLTDTSLSAPSGAKRMISTAPASETSHQTVFGTETDWGWIFPGGNTAGWAAGDTEPSVNPRGFLADTTSLTGATLPAGSYAPSLKVKVLTSGVSASFTERVWLWHSDGTFSLVAKYTTGALTMTSSPQTITAWTEVQAQADTPTATGDLLFADVAADILANTAGSSTNAFTMSLNGGAAESLVTPGLVTSGASP